MRLFVVATLGFVLATSGCAPAVRLLYLKPSSSPSLGSPVVVTQVTPNASAATALLQPGDIIEYVDGKSVTGWKQFYALLASKREASLGYVRGNEHRQVTLQYDPWKWETLGLEVVPVNGTIEAADGCQTHYQYRDGLLVASHAVTDSKRQGFLILFFHVANMRDAPTEIRPDALTVLDGYRSVMTPYDALALAGGIQESAERRSNQFLAYSQIAKPAPSYQVTGTAYTRGQVQPSGAYYGNTTYSGVAQPVPDFSQMAMAFGYVAAVQQAENARAAAAKMLEMAFRTGPIPPQANRLGVVFFPQPRKYPVYVSLVVDGKRLEYVFDEPVSKTNGPA